MIVKMGDGPEMRHGLGLRGRDEVEGRENRRREGDLRGKVGKKWEEGRGEEGMVKGW